MSSNWFEIIGFTCLLFTVWAFVDIISGMFVVAAIASGNVLAMIVVLPVAFAAFIGATLLLLSVTITEWKEFMLKRRYRL